MNLDDMRAIDYLLHSLEEGQIDIARKAKTESMRDSKKVSAILKTKLQLLGYPCSILVQFNGEERNESRNPESREDE